MFDQAPPHMLTLWPKLESSLNVIAKRDGSGAIFFFSGDDQSLAACKAIANLTRWPTVTIPVTRDAERTFRETVREPLIKKDVQHGLFDERAAGMTVIVPNVDDRPEDFHSAMRFLFDHARRPYILLASGKDESRLPSYLGGHYYPCHKKGASLGSRHQDYGSV